MSFNDLMQSLQSMQATSTCNTWIKTSRGWVIRRNPGAEAGPDVNTPAMSNIVLRRTDAIQSNREESQSRNVRVSGSRGQRRVSVCISQFLDKMGFLEAVYDIRQQQYLFDVMSLLLREWLGKMSGTAHRQLFKILERMITHTLDSEIQIPRTRAILDCASTALSSELQGRIGCKSVWNRHIQNVSNLRTKLQQFQYRERQEDGLPTLLDLPKEVIFEIVMKLTDHRDVVNLGKTCTDLYYICEAPMVWEELTEVHFTEKQISTFTEEADFSYGVPWKHLYHRCFKKYGLRQTFADQLVICSACKTMHWLYIGHHCWSLPEDVPGSYMEPVLPKELLTMLI